MSETKAKVEHSPGKEIPGAGGVNYGQVETWKKKYNKGAKKVIKLHVVITPSEGDKEADIAVGFVKPMDRNITARALTRYTKNERLEAGEFILQNCWLGGDERIQQDEDAGIAAAIELIGAMDFLESGAEPA